MANLGGTFVIGRFLGVTEEDYPRLRIRVSEPTEQRPGGWEERLEFSPFNPRNGDPMLPASLAQGDLVAVRVRHRPVDYMKDGKPAVFVKASVLEVIPWAQASPLAPVAAVA